MQIAVKVDESVYKLEDGELVCVHDEVIVERVAFPVMVNGEVDEREELIASCANEDCGEQMENVEEYLDF